MRAAVAAVAIAGCSVSPKFAGLDEASRRFEMTDTMPVTTLANGMRVVVVPDTRTNLVTVDMRYEVGAADDPPGRAGMAHYAEHVMWEAGISKSARRGWRGRSAAALAVPGEYVSAKRHWSCRRLMRPRASAMRAGTVNGLIP